MNHSHGHEMRLQKARELAREERETRRERFEKEEKRQNKIDRMCRAMAHIDKLEEILADYETTGDHDHSLNGNRPIAPGAPCPDGDCMVARARKIIAALKSTK